MVVVGSPKRGPLADAIAEYEGRVRRYWPLLVEEVREESAKSRSPEQVKAGEGERMVTRIPNGARVITCEVTGSRWSSERLATELRDARDAGHSVCFMIGGAFGLGDEVLQRAQARLSLSEFTLPHEMARLVLTEQIYRAGTIVRGEPYHK